MDCFIYNCKNVWVIWWIIETGWKKKDRMELKKESSMRVQAERRGFSPSQINIYIKSSMGNEPWVASGSRPSLGEIFESCQD